MNEMTKQYKEYYRYLCECNNNDLLFEYRFCCLEVERLTRLVKTFPSVELTLKCEKNRMNMCKTEIFKRMGGNK